MSLDVMLRNTEPCPHCGKPIGADYVYNANITHNLGNMANKAGIYEALWRPEEINAVYAKDIIPLLQKGLAKLYAKPAYYQKFNAPNGWGLYEHFVPFVREYLEACEKNPEAIISVSR